MKVNVAEISNISTQIVNINYLAIAPELSASSVPPQSNGQLNIKPGSSITIEEPRIDVSQIQSLQRAGLVVYVVRTVDATGLPSMRCFASRSDQEYSGQFDGPPFTLYRGGAANYKTASLIDATGDYFCYVTWIRFNETLMTGPIGQNIVGYGYNGNNDLVPQFGTQIRTTNHSATEYSGLTGLWSIQARFAGYNGSAPFLQHDTTPANPARLHNWIRVAVIIRPSGDHIYVDQERTSESHVGGISLTNGSVIGHVHQIGGGNPASVGDNYDIAHFGMAVGSDNKLDEEDMEEHFALGPTASFSQLSNRFKDRISHWWDLEDRFAAKGGVLLESDSYSGNIRTSHTTVL